MTTTDDEADRRRFFRIDDAVHLTYQPVPPDELEKRVARLEAGLDAHFTVMSSIAALSSQMATVLRRIETDDPEIASYLRALDQKVDLLGRALMTQQSELTEKQAAPVNLSASGIALHGRESLETGTWLEIKMLLMPSFAGVMCYGQVVSCEPLADGDEYDFLIRVDFAHLREEDRDVLIRHIIRREGDLLRERRLQRENAE